MEKSLNLGYELAAKAISDAHYLGYQSGTENERSRIIEILIGQEVIRRDSFGKLVYHNEGDLYAKDIEGLEPKADL